jgi:LacI family transcriptional regulator
VVTRNDVARRAGTSPAMVSYVLNGGPRKVAAETQMRIREAVAELNYRPNRLARSLRSNRTMTLGMIFPDSANAYFAELTNAIEDASFDRGFTLLLGNSAENLDRQLRYAESFVDHQVDGLFIVPAVGTDADDFVARFPSQHIVALDRRLGSQDIPTLAVDNRAVDAGAVRHLIGHGHSQIACVAGPAASSSARDRVEGYRDALAEAGVASNEDLVSYGAFGLESGFASAADLLARCNVDALFVTSDEQAIGVLKAITHSGARCPADIAVVSFDGIASAIYSSPALTTMAQPFSLLGQRALEVMLRLIDGGTPEQEMLSLSASLAVRESCGCTTEGVR